MKTELWVDTDGRALQPMMVVEGRVFFRENAIVRFLLEDGPNDMNRLARMPFSAEDRAQFAQLLGYAVNGFGELSYVPERLIVEADRQAAQLLADSKK